MYGGRPALDRFAAAAAASVHPVVYNGDINTAGDFRCAAARFPEINRWMIGRGVLADLQVAEKIRGKNCGGDHGATRFRGFHDDLVEGYRHRLSGPGHLLDRMKGFWQYLAIGFEGGKKTAKKIHRCRQMSRYTELVERFFDAKPEWRGFPDGMSLEEHRA
jgi:tRNA-dihydrouridine synthase